MGKNTAPFDRNAHYDAKTTKELEQLLKNAEAFLAKYPEFTVGRHNDYMHMLKLKIAERIGRK